MNIDCILDKREMLGFVSVIRMLWICKRIALF